MDFWLGRRIAVAEAEASIQQQGLEQNHASSIMFEDYTIIPKVYGLGCSRQCKTLYINRGTRNGKVLLLLPMIELARLNTVIVLEPKLLTDHTCDALLIEITDH